MVICLREGRKQRKLGYQPEMGLQRPRAGSELVPQEWPRTAGPLKAQLREAAPQLA